MKNINDSTVGLGTFPFSGVFSSVTQQDAEEIFSIFRLLGGYYLETAPVYPIKDVDVGKLISTTDRNSLFIATKCVTGADKNGNKIRSGKRDFIQWQCESELARLNIDQIDLLQAHTVPGDTSMEELGQTLQALKEMGLVRYVGLSNVNMSQIEEAAKSVKVDFIQNRFSFIHRNEHLKIQQVCEKKGIRLNPYQVIERGLLATDTLAPKERREGDLRNSKHEYKSEPYSVIRQWVEETILPIARSISVSLETLMVAWSLHQPNVSVPVVGVTNPTQLKGIFQALSLSESELPLDELELEFSKLCSSIKEKYGLAIQEFRGL